MNSEILAAVITGVLALLGTATGTFGGIKAAQKVNEVKIEELTREVREHNNFAKRMPVVEEKIKIINHRIECMEERILFYERYYEKIKIPGALGFGYWFNLRHGFSAKLPPATGLDRHCRLPLHHFWYCQQPLR